MPSNKPNDIPSDEITDQNVYLNRRNFMRAGIVVATTAATGLIYRKLNHPRLTQSQQPQLANLLATTEPNISNGFVTDENQTSLDDITHYNNFYAFSTDKESVAEEAQHFVSRPWSIAVGGLVHKPTTFDLDDLL